MQEGRFAGKICSGIESGSSTIMTNAAKPTNFCRQGQLNWHPLEGTTYRTLQFLHCVIGYHIKQFRSNHWALLSPAVVSKERAIFGSNIFQCQCKSKKTAAVIPNLVFWQHNSRILILLWKISFLFGSIVVTDLPVYNSYVNFICNEFDEVYIKKYILYCCCSY